MKTTIAALGLMLLVSAVGAATNAPESPTGSGTNAPAIKIPKSDFILPTSTDQGRDPFFPLSSRLRSRPTSNETIKAAPVTLSLKGVSGTEGRRFALINDKTFAAGEEREIAVGNGRVRVHCLEIREDSVTVDVNGNRQELRLRPGL